MHLRGEHTWQEVTSQGQAWEAALQAAHRHGDRIGQLFAEADPEQLVLAGCGSSYYLCLSVASWLRKTMHLPVFAVPSSELLLYPETVYLRGRRALTIAVSRSGETTETLLAARYASRQGPVLTVSCRPRGGLCEGSSVHLALPEVDEKSVVMTRSFTSMWILLHAVFALLRGDANHVDRLRTLSYHFNALVEEWCRTAQHLGEEETTSHFVFLGTGPTYGLAWEAALKMQEMALTAAEAYHTLEFRHGHMSRLGPGSLVVILPSLPAHDEEQQLAGEVREMSGRTVALGRQLPGSSTFVPLTDSKHGPWDEWSHAVLALVPLQMLAYYRSVSRGFDPDQPPHVSRVVSLSR